MLKFLETAGGIYEIRIVTADWARFSEDLTKNSVVLLDTSAEDSLSYRIRIYRKDLKKVKNLAQRRGDQVAILRRKGLYFTFLDLQKRPALLLGLLILLLLFLFLPTRVLFIKITGNDSVPDLKILEEAENCGVRFGALRKNLRSEKIKNRLLAEIPELSWAGVNTSGCVAEISVREHKRPPKLSTPSNTQAIVSARDSVIGSCTLKSGKLLVKPGQAAVKGQILISPYEECGKKLRVSAAVGEIYGFTRRDQEIITPASWMLRRLPQKEKKAITLVLGKKRIKIYGSSGNEDPVCDRMYAEYYITLPGSNVLPVSMIVDRYLYAPAAELQKDSSEVQKALRDSMMQNLKTQMIAGEILKSREQFSEDRNLYSLKGSYLCYEMIGRARQEKIGEKQDQWNES